MLTKFFSSASLFLAVTPDAALDPNAASPLSSMLMTLLLPVVLIVVFYFMLIRPESKRKKAAAKMRSELIVGDEITTIGGIVGKVVQIKDDTITLETGAEKSRVKLMRWAISSKGEQISDK